MASSEQKVKAVHPKATKKSYKKTAGGSYYLIWSGFPGATGSKRLGEGKTASAAWVDAAKNVEQAAAQAPALAQ